MGLVERNSHWKRCRLIASGVEVDSKRFLKKIPIQKRVVLHRDWMTFSRRAVIVRTLRKLRVRI